MTVRRVCEINWRGATNDGRALHTIRCDREQRDGRVGEQSSLRKPSTGWDNPGAVIQIVRGLLRMKAWLLPGFQEKNKSARLYFGKATILGYIGADFMKAQALIRVQFPELSKILACGEAVTHRTLTPLSAGSNPATPTIICKRKGRTYETYQEFSHSLEPLHSPHSRLHNRRRLRLSCGSLLCSRLDKGRR